MNNKEKEFKEEIKEETKLPKKKKKEDKTLLELENLKKEAAL